MCLFHEYVNVRHYSQSSKAMDGVISDGIAYSCTGQLFPQEKYDFKSDIEKATLRGLSLAPVAWHFNPRAIVS